MYPIRYIAEGATDTVTVRSSLGVNADVLRKGKLAGEALHLDVGTSLARRIITGRRKEPSCVRLEIPAKRVAVPRFSEGPTVPLHADKTPDSHFATPGSSWGDPLNSEDLPESAA
jgi:hypothetical protein